MKTYTAERGGVIRDEHGRKVGHAVGAGPGFRLDVEGAHAIAWPADGGAPSLMKAARPEGHSRGCSCVICEQLDEPETDDIEDVTRPCTETEQEVAKTEMQKLMKARAKSLEALVSKMEAALPTVTDPAVRATVSAAVSRYQLGRLNKARGVPTNGAPLVEGRGESEVERAVREAAQLVLDSQARATAAPAPTASARGQLEQVRDGTAPVRTLPGQAFLPSLMHDGGADRDLQALEKAVRDAPTFVARARASEALTRARLRVLNANLIAQGRLRMR